MYYHYYYHYHYYYYYYLLALKQYDQAVQQGVKVAVNMMEFCSDFQEVFPITNGGV